MHTHVWLPQEGATRTVVALHGTGGDETDLVPLVRELYPEANILGLRGNVNEGGARRFFRRYAEGLFDEADIRTRAADLTAFWPAAVAEYGIDAETAVWLGYSNGANMIGALLLLGDVVREAVLLRAQNLFAEAVDGTATVKARVTLVSGEYDPIVPVAEAAKLRDALTARGHAVQQHLLPTGHQLSRYDLEALGG
ncbi:MAG: alpha/beta hydrolase [Alphaproteobacteria bacterium]|nr:MAG: alpha/beta hydrolase [Alphaproteobacteria bacterium]